MVREQILRLEHGFFEDGSPEFYRRVLADDAMLVLPGIGRMTKSQCVEAVADATPWTSHTLEQIEFVAVESQSLALSYLATAHREGQEPYRAWMSSVWARRDDSWQLVVHQQTPVNVAD